MKFILLLPFVVCPLLANQPEGMLQDPTPQKTIEEQDLEVEKNVWFLDLPSEVHQHIVSFAPPEAIINLSLTNSHFLNICEEAAEKQLGLKLPVFSKFNKPGLAAYKFRYYLLCILKHYVRSTQTYPEYVFENTRYYLSRHKKFYSFCQQNQLEVHSALFNALLLDTDPPSVKYFNAIRPNNSLSKHAYQEFLEKFFLAFHSKDPLITDLGYIMSSAVANMEADLSHRREEYEGGVDNLMKFCLFAHEFNEASLPCFAKELIKTGNLFTWRIFGKPNVRLDALIQMLKSWGEDSREDYCKYCDEALFQICQPGLPPSEASTYILAHCYLFGLGVNKDYDKARDLLDELDYGYNPDYLQGIMCEYGWGVDLDLEAAKEHYETSVNVERNYSDAYYRLAMIKLRQNRNLYFQEATALLKKQLSLNMQRQLLSWETTVWIWRISKMLINITI